MLCYQDKGEKFRYSTRLFAGKGGLVNNRVKAVSLDDYGLNEKLDSFEKIIGEIEKEAISKGVRYSVDEVEVKFRERNKSVEPNILSPGINANHSEFFDLYDKFIEQNRAIKSKATIYHYQICKKTLLSFEKMTKKPISFKMINGQFYQQFQNYLITDKKFLNNTVGGHIKNFKVFLNYAVRNEFTDVKFIFKDFKTISEEIEIIALSEDELFRIYNCEDLSEPQKKSRDYLCFECFTGLRFSDIGNLKNENIKDDFIVLKTQKTKDNLYIPINVFAREILDRYKGQFEASPLPPPYANQVINRYIKEVAQKAMINELTMVEKFNGSNRLTVTKPKHAFISTHTGRRTFITLSYEKGMQTEMIMKITGIKKWETLKKYLKVSEKSKLIKMNEFWNHDIMNKNKITD